MRKNNSSESSPILKVPFVRRLVLSFNRIALNERNEHQVYVIPPQREVPGSVSSLPSNKGETQNKADPHLDDNNIKSLSLSLSRIFFEEKKVVSEKDKHNNLAS